MEKDKTIIKWIIDKDSIKDSLIYNGVATIHYKEEELVLDIDELHGILDQLHAISLGFADRLTFFEDDELMEYKWKAKK